MAHTDTAKPKRTRVPLPTERPPRVQIEDPQPVIDAGRYRAKACVGDLVGASATIFCDGHDALAAIVRYRRRGEGRWRMAALVPSATGVDRWEGSFEVDSVGRWQWQIEARIDRFATWRSELERKLAAGETELGAELAEGAQILADVRERARRSDGAPIGAALPVIEGADRSIEERSKAALDPLLAATCARWPDPSESVRGPLVEVDVERLRARVGAWYELFPRSWGGLAGVEHHLPAFAELGIDVIYLPPIHPIGAPRARAATTHKRPRRATRAAHGRSAVPEGGHRRSTPSSGRSRTSTVSSRRPARTGSRSRSTSRCSARPTTPGSRAPRMVPSAPRWHLKYAENPPKRYRDIYNVDFACDDWRGLWRALREIVLFWVGHGVQAFRVDNPHTKPLAFWEWLIESSGRSTRT